MWSFTKEEELSPEQIEEMKNQWFSLEEAIEELAVNGDKLSEATFRRRAKQVNKSKEFFELGKPQIDKAKSGGKGASKYIYNRAFVEALRSFAISDTYKQFEEEPINYFLADNWKEDIEGEFKEVLKSHNIDSSQIYGAVAELTKIIGDNIMPKYHSLLGQNKLLVHQNKKLEDTKEYYSSMYRGVEANANILKDIEKYIKDDISKSSETMGNKVAYHTKLTINVNQKLEEVLKLLEDIKGEGK